MTAVFGLDESDSDTFALGELRAQAEVIGALRTLLDAMVAAIDEEPPITEADIDVEPRRSRRSSQQRSASNQNPRKICTHIAGLCAQAPFQSSCGGVCAHIAGLCAQASFHGGSA